MTISISVCSNMCPMCKLPVTLGGGSSRVNPGSFFALVAASGVVTEKSFSLTQYSAQRGSIAPGSYVLGSSCAIRPEETNLRYYRRAAEVGKRRRGEGKETPSERPPGHAQWVLGLDGNVN